MAQVAAREYYGAMGAAVADRTINRQLFTAAQRAELSNPLVLNPRDPRFHKWNSTAILSDFPVVYDSECAFQTAAPKTAPETWADVAARVALGNSLLEPANDNRDYERDQMEHHLRQASLLMSGRHLQHGDRTQPDKNLEVFSNCSSAACSFLLFYLLLNGAGVGRRYDDSLILADFNQMPIIECVISMDHPDVVHGHVQGFEAPNVAWKHYFGKKITHHMVGDSREGWQSAIELIERMTFERRRDEVLLLNFSNVRERNAPIMGMQGRPASGPGPLMEAIRKIAALRDAGYAPWMAAMFADHYLAECVLVGGARRAARMGVKHWTDASIFEFISIKRIHGLWSSNNSVLVDREFWDGVRRVRKLIAKVGGVDEDELERFYQAIQQEGDATARQVHAHRVLMAAAKASYFDGTGEPGFINQDMLAQKDIGYEGYLDGLFAHSKRLQLSGDTLPYMKALARASWECKLYMIVNPCVIGSTPLLTRKGNFPIEDLVGQSVDMWNGREFSTVVPFSTGVNPVWTVKFSDGTSLDCTPYHKFLIEDEDEESGGAHRKALRDMRVGDKLAEFLLPESEVRRLLTVTEIINEGRFEETFCVKEPIRHTATFNGIVTGNCSEIPLNQLGAYCVIGTVVPYHTPTLAEFEGAIRTAVRALMRTNLLDSVYGRETARTNRIGVGLTGIHEWAYDYFGFTWHDIINENKSIEMWKTLSHMKRAAVDETIRYAMHLGVAIPHTNTMLAPNGTIAKLFGLTEGGHLPAMREYLRWVQFRHDDPLVQTYKDMGYPTRDLKTYGGTTIVGFPTKPAICNIDGGDWVVTAPEATPEDQYEYLRLIEKWWIRGMEEDGATPLVESGNQASYTLKYDRKIVSFDRFLETLIDGQSSIRCCSVMPDEDRSAYEYLPESPVTKAEFDRIAAQIEAANRKVKEDVDFAHVDCASGACPVNFEKDAL